MGALVKYDRESLMKKQPNQLRLVLAREFKHTRGISQLTQVELVDEILKRVGENKQAIDANQGIDVDCIYRDESETQYKVLAVNTDDVDIEDEFGNEDSYPIKEFKEEFRKMLYDKFIQPTPVVEIEEVKDLSEDKPKSKSEKVREILEELISENRKYTSGTIMLLMKDRHNETIHRSFVITIAKKYEKSRKKALQQEIMQEPVE